MPLVCQIASISFIIIPPHALSSRLSHPHPLISIPPSGLPAIVHRTSQISCWRNNPTCVQRSLQRGKCLSNTLQFQITFCPLSNPYAASILASCFDSTLAPIYPVVLNHSL